MKKWGSNSWLIDSTTSDVQRNENPICQPFSIRGYVAETRNTNPKACIPFDGIGENTWEQLRGSLDIPCSRWWRCKSCVHELVIPSSTASDGRSNAEQTSLQLCISEKEKYSSLELRDAGGSELGDSYRCSEATNMVNNDGERELPNTNPLELLARAAEMVFDLPKRQETFQGLNVKEDSSLDQTTAGLGTDAIVREGDRFPSEVNDLVDDKSPSEVNDLVDSDDERKIKKVRSLKELTRVLNEKASAGISVTANTLQHRKGNPSLSKGKDIHSKVEGQEFVRPQGSGKAKRHCPLSPNKDPISKKHAKASGSFPQPLLPHNRMRNPNDGK